MHIKNIALRAIALGTAAISVMAASQPIDWWSPCADAAILTNWVQVRIGLWYTFGVYPDLLSPSKREEVSKLLDGFYLPYVPDMEILKKVFDIVGPDYMQFSIGTVLNDYWSENPCVNPTPTLPTSSVDSSSTDTFSTVESESSSDDIDSTTSSESSSSDINSTISSNLSSSDTFSTISSGSSSSDTYSTISFESSSSEVYSTSSVHSSTPAEPTTETTGIYSTTPPPNSSAPTSLYSTIPLHKCYVAVVVTSRVIPVYTSVY